MKGTSLAVRCFWILRNGRRNVAKLGDAANQKCLISSLTRRNDISGIHLKQEVYSHTLVRLATYPDISRSNISCWKCGKQLSATSKFFCEHCSIIIPSHHLSHFEIFGFDESFDISIQELQKRFKNCQRLFHPDKFTLKSKNEKRLSEELSSLINIAYSTLLDPLQRAVYILEMRGVTIEEDTQMSDPEFLMEIMELNEQIASSETDESLMDLQRQINNKRKKVIDHISETFHGNELQNAKTLAVKLRYYNNMAEKLRHLIPPS